MSHIIRVYYYVIIACYVITRCLETTITIIIHYHVRDNINTMVLLLDGFVYPERDLVDNKTGVRISKLWPEEQPHGDRVVEQLMFVPPHYKYENAPIKRILIFNHLDSWMIEEGQVEFVWNDCPVNRCTLTTKRSSIINMDAVVFRDKYLNYGLPWNAKNQVRWYTLLDRQLLLLLLCFRLLTKNPWPKWNAQYYIVLALLQIRIFYIQRSAYYAKLDFYIQENSVNWIASYRHDSDIVVPYGRWAYYGNSSVTHDKQLKRNYAKNKKQLVAAVFSQCDTDNGRMAYARELGKHIIVDIYGQCGDYYAVESDSLFKTLGRQYRFYLAFEDSNCINYITETFFVQGLGWA